MKSAGKYWFPAKTYGWGWGPPSTWQGWLVLGLYLAGMVALALALDLETQIVEFLVGVAVLTTALLVVCWVKGEPPKWRWGSK